MNVDNQVFQTGVVSKKNLEEKEMLEEIDKPFKDIVVRVV